MKFIVDELPYYREDCPFYEMCQDNIYADKCPRYLEAQIVPDDVRIKLVDGNGKEIDDDQI